MTTQADQLVFTSKKGNEITYSYLIATRFERQHQHVLRLIDTLILDLNDAESDGLFELSDGYAPKDLFYECFRVDEKNRRLRYFVVRYEGFELLSMRMEGKRALKFQLQFLKAFKQLRAENEAFRAEQLAAQSAEDGILRLVPFTSASKQVECSKLVSSHYMRGTRDANPAMEHFRQTFKAVTGKTPTNYVHQKAKEGHRVLSQSGRGALRKLEPEKACVIAMMDEQVLLHGVSVEQQQLAGLPEALAPAFAALLKLGYGLPRLEIPQPKVSQAKQPARIGGR